MNRFITLQQDVSDSRIPVTMMTPRSDTHELRKKEKTMLTDYIKNQYQSAHDPTIYSKHHERNIVVHCSRPVLSPLRCYL